MDKLTKRSKRRTRANTQFAHLLLIVRHGNLFIFCDFLGQVLRLSKIIFKPFWDSEFFNFVSTNELKDDESADVMKRWHFAESAGTSRK